MVPQSHRSPQRLHHPRPDARPVGRQHIGQQLISQHGGVGRICSCSLHSGPQALWTGLSGMALIADAQISAELGHANAGAVVRHDHHGDPGALQAVDPLVQGVIRAADRLGRQCICGTGGVFMKNIDIHGMTNMELIRGGIAEWYWATDYIHGDLYEAEELFRQGHLVRSNRLYLIHYPDGMIYEPVHSADGQYLGTPVYDGSSVVLLVVSFTESVIRIMRFLHQQVEVQEVARLPLSAVKDCYNLMLHTSPLSLTRQPNDGTFEIIWPEHVRFAINDREALNFRDGDKLYFNVWYEDPDYREETVVRSLHDGTILERFPGDIRIMPNGERWLIK